mgnify:CR=1 FL=1
MRAARISGLEATPDDHHAFANAHVLLTAASLVGDCELGFAEFFVTAEFAVVFDDDFKEGVGRAGDFEAFFVGVERDGALGSLDVVCLVNLLFAERDVDAEVGVGGEAVGTEDSDVGCTLFGAADAVAVAEAAVEA